MDQIALVSFCGALPKPRLVTSTWSALAACTRGIGPDGIHNYFNQIVDADTDLGGSDGTGGPARAQSPVLAWPGLIAHLIPHATPR